MKACTAICGLSAVFVLVTCSAEEPAWRGAVALESVRQSENKFSRSWGSGFFLKTSKAAYLVTADHVARKTTSETVVTQTFETGAKSFPLGKLSESADARWIKNEQVDLALVKLNMSALEEHGLATIAFDELTDETIPIGRSINVVGYPFANVPKNESTAHPIVVSLTCASIE
ncbi:MAG: trypsin-like peptidase domain-containing protein, partial [Planctomycetaceae bacterium]